MYYGLVHFPDIDTASINQLRRKYDPTVDRIAPHITIMFPVPDAVDLPVLVQHIEQVLADRPAFPLRLKGLVKSWDHWLFLTVQTGNQAIIELNTAIYTGILQPYHRADLEFVPHVSLGLFVIDSGYDHADPQQLAFDEDRYQIALREAEALNLDFTCTVDRLHLVAITDDFASITPVQAFTLSK